VAKAEQKRLMAIIDLKGGAEALDKARELAGSAISGMDYLGGILERLAVYGFKNCTVDFSVARGLDYYTGMVFEIDAPCLGAEKQICGGGAYSLAELFGGEPVNSTGYAFGFDRIMLAMESSGIQIPIPGLQAYIIPIGEKARAEALDILRTLRSAGIQSDMDLMGRNISKALAYANSAGAEKAIIIGEKEIAEASVTVRDMKSGEQSKYPISDLLRGFLKGVI
jgi:histidyl-tRNA synthetase